MSLPAMRLRLRVSIFFAFLFVSVYLFLPLRQHHRLISVLTTPTPSPTPPATPPPTPPPTGTEHKNIVNLEKNVAEFQKQFFEESEALGR
jgi:hypothetical protein